MGLYNIFHVKPEYVLSAPIPPDDQPVEVALFPIPNMVAFPGTIVPLHVFEPRYRRLVHDCVEQERLLGVSHTRKTIRKPPQNQTIEEALSSNQATYQPWDVFSAGQCRIIETLQDGRLLAEIAMSQRFKIEQEIQSLPYRIVLCTPVNDTLPSSTNPDTTQLQKSVHLRLIEIVQNQNPDLAKALADSTWVEMSPAEYSFRIFEVLRFDADIMQDILEMQDAEQRLSLTRDLLAPGST